MISAGASKLLGLEVAGDVEEAGEGVTTFKKGNKVIALLDGGGCDSQKALMHFCFATAVYYG